MKLVTRVCEPSVFGHPLTATGAADVDDPFSATVVVTSDSATVEVGAVSDDPPKIPPEMRNKRKTTAMAPPP